MICKSCNVEKLITCFREYKTRQGNPSIRHTCRQCESDYQSKNRDKGCIADKKWYQKNKIKKRETDKKRSKKIKELGVIFLKNQCYKCKEAKSQDSFFRDSSRLSGLSGLCKLCTDEYIDKTRAQCNTRSRLHQSKRRRRIPAWVDMDKIYEIYENCPEGYEVDHIIPLAGKLVSGLHVPENLQYLTRKENAEKSNKFTPYVRIIGESSEDK